MKQNEKLSTLNTDAKHIEIILNKGGYWAIDMRSGVRKTGTGVYRG